MIGMVFGSVGMPFWPWHALHICTFASISSAADAGTAVIPKPIPTPTIVENRRVNMAGFLPPATARGAREPQVSGQRAQRARLAGTRLTVTRLTVTRLTVTRLTVTRLTVTRLAGTRRPARPGSP